MTHPIEKFSPFAERMTRENLPDIVIRTFEHYYRQLASGKTGLIPESEIQPVESLPASEDFSPEMAAAGRAVLPHAILLKLNGGLGTGMGLAKAKSLLPVKEGLTFLDIIARQTTMGGVPLVLMNSFNTRDDSLAALARYDDLPGEIPLDFLQHKVPKIIQTDLSLADWSRDPALQWCPPGHGDIYTALVTSGMLDKLLAGGYRYAFVSNADNLGAVMDEALLGYFASNELPFMMEVSPRTEADKKGGHLAQSPTGNFLLRESAQCPPEDEATFQDINRHRYFNTNNLWINLPALQSMLDERDGILGLAMIRNAKTLDPRDRQSPPVYQLETALGSAIEVFPGAGAVLIPKSRFAPIKKTNDLLDVRSDNYILTDDFQVTANTARKLERAFIDLDPVFYQFIDDFDARFPQGAPSMLECSRLVVRGDIHFGKDVVLRGDVELINGTNGPVEVPDGAVLTGRVIF
ncbi:MAG: UTP--glucose-1-phosphate uridylyltransferase [Gemmatimonadales bacterium]|nr:UTP--glucose-1-phosphate uridylyltransferase [Gemmatimonadales bacterium]